MTLTKDDSFSQYFSPDEEFIELLAQTDGQLPGDIQLDTGASSESVSTASVVGRKRHRSPDEEKLPELPKQVVKPGAEASAPNIDLGIYGPSSFGGYGQYMSRKRAKLQIQNVEIRPASESAIFNGVSIYVNGHTVPSLQELRKMIIQHGGVFQPYLDRKRIVTHIITTGITAAKLKSWKHMKVVTPDWIVKSIERKVLLPWTDFVYRPTEGRDGRQGVRSPQKTIQVSGTKVPNEELIFTGSTVSPRSFQTSLTGQNSHMSGMGLARSHSGSVVPSLGRLSPVSPSANAKLLPGIQPANLAPHGSSPTNAAASARLKSPAHRASSFRGDIDNTPQVSNIEFLPERPSNITGPSPMKSTSKLAQTSLFDSSKPLKPVNPYTTDLATTEDEERIPSYAEHDSNPHAALAMKSTQWRQEHTSVSDSFIEGYYKNSRLHYLSTWKAELRSIVAEAHEHMESPSAGQIYPQAEKSTHLGTEPRKWSIFSGKGKEREREQFIMHCDFDSFFVAVGLIDRPELRGKPIVVCHSQGAQGGGSSTSEVASASYEARKFGIRNGMSLGQARKLCPAIQTIPYEFKRYKELSLKFYSILMPIADDIQAVSVDEALIDATSAVEGVKTQFMVTSPHATVVELAQHDFAKDFADILRARVKAATGCEISIGISYNILLARLATRKAKPASSYHLTASQAPEFLATVDVDQLHGFGHAVRSKAEARFGTTMLGDLGKISKATLSQVFGKKTGETLWNAARGIDHTKLESDKPRKSVSCDINFGIRFENDEQAEKFIKQMAVEVSTRLNDIAMRGQSLTLKIMKRHPSAPIEPPKFLGHGHCETFSKTSPLATSGGGPTSDSNLIGAQALRLLHSFGFDPKELRGISIQIQKLESVPKSPKMTPAARRAAVAHLPEEARLAVDSSATKQPVILVEPPSSSLEEVPAAVSEAATDAMDLDPEFLNALPPDIRKEVEQEYLASKSTSNPARRKDIHLAPSRPPDKSLHRITQQLAQRNSPATSPSKKTFFNRKPQPGTLNVPLANLKKLGIDPDVFYNLPIEYQREQLAIQRALQNRSLKDTGVFRPRPKIELVGRITPEFKPRKLPPPQANFIEEPALVRKGRKGSESKKIVDTSELQDMVSSWIDSFDDEPPREKDINYIAKFLLECVDSFSPTETPIGRAVCVLKWWRIRLRMKWPEPPWSSTSLPVSPPSRVVSGAVGENWWVAFWEVKMKMDAALRPKYGGILSLK